MIQIHYLSDPPEMTADVSTDAWADVSWHNGFSIPGSPNIKVLSVTSFAMVHDGDSLYIGAKCGAAPGSTAESLAHERVHILLDPEGNGRWAAKLIGNADGSISATIAFESSGNDGWPGEVGFDARLGAQQWTALVKVPLSQLKHEDGVFRRLRFNVARLIAVPERWLCCPSLAETVFWEPRNATAEAEFERPELLTPFAWPVRRTGRARVSKVNGKNVCRQGVRTTNLTTEPRETELHVAFLEPGHQPSGQTQRRLRVAPCESHVESVELPLPEEFNFGFVCVALYEPDSGRCVSENRFLVEADPLSWKEHYVKRADGRNGYTCHSAQMQFLPRYEGRKTAPYGLATMDNGEVVCVVIGWPAVTGQPIQTLVAISEDEGAT
jgi:hypothetical protein